MSRRGDGGGNRGVRTENSKQQRGSSQDEAVAAEVWYYSKSYSVMHERRSYSHEKHSSQWKGM